MGGRAGSGGSGGFGANSRIKGSRKTAGQLASQVYRLMENTKMGANGLGVMQNGRYRKMALKAVQNIQKNLLAPQGKALIQNMYTGEITIGKLPKGYS